MKAIELLRKKDLHEPIGIPKSTVADWLNEFKPYIPIIKKGNVTYYKQEAIDVLKFIKACRDKNHSKVEIMELLAERFPMMVDEQETDEVQEVMEQVQYRDNLLKVMSAVGQTISKLEEHNELIRKQNEEITEQKEKLNALESKVNEIDELKTELERVKKELAAAKEKKGFFNRLFGR
jgi:DNA-binding transcriptional MerR regulator